MLVTAATAITVEERLTAAVIDPHSSAAVASKHLAWGEFYSTAYSTRYQDAGAVLHTLTIIHKHNATFCCTFQTPRFAIVV